MIHVNPQKEPPGFNKKVGRPGREFLAHTPRPSTAEWEKHAYWRKISNDLYDKYDGICAYSCHWIPPDTGGQSVEHFRPKSLCPKDAYIWRNYRLVCLTMNGRKGVSRDVLDPFRVKDGWFIIEFPSLFVKPFAGLTRGIQRKVQQTIDILNLNDESTCLRNREKYVREYCLGEISFEHLRREAPFVAKEILRQRLQRSIRSRMPYRENSNIHQ